MALHCDRIPWYLVPGSSEALNEYRRRVEEAGIGTGIGFGFAFPAVLGATTCPAESIREIHR
jgi:hypothetical protein